MYRVLDSVRVQTYEPSEVLVINDGSTNRINLMVEKLFPEFKLLNLDGNHGVSYARNFGAKAAQGEILFFVDSDVILDPDTIQKMTELFNRPGIDIAQATVKSEPKNSPLAGILMSNLYNYTYLTREKAFTNNLISYCFAIKKGVFLGLGGFDEKYKLPGGEEFHFAVKAASEGHSIYYDKRVTVRHLFKSFPELTRNLFRRIPLTVNILLSKGRLKNIPIIGEKNHFIYIGSFLFCASLFSFIAWFIFKTGFLLFLSIFSFLALNIISFDFYKYLIKGYGPKKFFCLLALYYFWLGVIFFSVLKGLWLYLKNLKNEP